MSKTDRWEFHLRRTDYDHATDVSFSHGDRRAMVRIFDDDSPNVVALALRELAAFAENAPAAGMEQRPLNWIEAEAARQAGAKLQVRDVMHGCVWIDEDFSDGGEITEYCSDLEWRVLRESNEDQTGRPPNIFAWQVEHSTQPLGHGIWDAETLAFLVQRTRAIRAAHARSLCSASPAGRCNTPADGRLVVVDGKLVPGDPDKYGVIALASKD